MEDKLLVGAQATLRRDLPLLLIEIWDDGKRREEGMSATRQQVIDAIMRLGYASIERVGNDDFLFSAA